MTQQSGYPDTPLSEVLNSPIPAALLPVASGQFLCAPKSYAPGSPTSLTVTSTTLAAWSSGNVCTNSFAAPASGSVLVSASMAVELSSGGQKLVLALAAVGTVSPVSGNVVNAQITTGATLIPWNVQFLVTGLTPGASYQFDLLGATSTTTATIIAYGNTGTTVGSGGVPVVMTVQAV